MLKGIFYNIITLPVTCLALCPMRWRFAWVCYLARWHWPVFRLLARFKLASLSLQGYRESALKFFTYALIRYKIDFKTSLKLPPSPLIEEGGILILTCHFYLNRLLMRWLCERERHVNVVTILSSLDEYVGRGYPVNIIPTDAQCFLRVRQKIKDGEIVYVTTEMATSATTYCQPVKLYGEQFYISGNALRFAERAAIPVFFAITSVSPEGQLVVKLARPSTTCAEIALTELCQFLATETA